MYKELSNCISAILGARSLEVDALIEINRILIEELEELNWKPHRLDNSQRKKIAHLVKALDKESRAKVISFVKVETVLLWYRDLIEKAEQKKDKIEQEKVSEMEKLILRIAKENDWGYKKIVGTFKALGVNTSDTTVANILRKHDIEPNDDDKPKGSWKEFLASHIDVWATDFFTTTYMFLTGPVSLYVLFFINIHTKEIVTSGVTEHPNEEWMKQQARNITGFNGELEDAKHLIHDRDKKYCTSFIEIMKSSGIECHKTAIRCPNMNAFAERFVRAIKNECLRKFILFREKQVRYILREYVDYFNHERPHQGLEGNVIPFESDLFQYKNGTGKVKLKKRLGGILKSYYREAA